MNSYEVLKECWINGSLYKPTQLIKLTDAQAKEWIDRNYIQLQNNKPKPTPRNRSNQNDSASANNQEITDSETVG